MGGSEGKREEPNRSLNIHETDGKMYKSFENGFPFRPYPTPTASMAKAFPIYKPPPRAMMTSISESVSALFANTCLEAGKVKNHGNIL